MEPYAWAVESKDEGREWTPEGLWFTDDACGEQMVRIVEVAEDAGVKVQVQRVPLYRHPTEGSTKEQPE